MNRSNKGTVRQLAKSMRDVIAKIDLASIQTGGDSIAFSQPEESSWPVHLIVFSHQLPNFVTTSQERIKYMFSRFGNVGPIQNHAEVLEGVLVGCIN